MFRLLHTSAVFVAVVMLAMPVGWCCAAHVRDVRVRTLASGCCHTPRQAPEKPTTPNAPASTCCFAQRANTSVVVEVESPASWLPLMPIVAIAPRVVSPHVAPRDGYADDGHSRQSLLCVWRC
jgi:hypothetical protein